MDDWQFTASYLANHIPEPNGIVGETQSIEVDSERLAELTRRDNWPDLGPTASIVTPAGSINM
jgi:hypothetical protein